MGEPRWRVLCADGMCLRSCASKSDAERLAALLDRGHRACGPHRVARIPEDDQ